jgi:hypothetical protein
MLDIRLRRLCIVRLWFERFSDAAGAQHSQLQKMRED